MNNIINFVKSSSWAKIALFFIVIATIVRSVFLVEVFNAVDHSFTQILEIYLVGFFFDFVTLLYFAAFPLFYYLLMPQKAFNSVFHQNLLKVFYLSFVCTIIFSAFSEWFFFDEFRTRFNFIAVDYLVYTQEVIGNIFESYPMYKLLTIIFIISLVIFYFTFRKIVMVKHENFASKLKFVAGFYVVLTCCFFFIDNSKLEKLTDNNYNKEIMENGIYQLFSAYRNNQIDYDQLYLTRDIKDIFQELRASIQKQNPKAKFLNDFDISRQIPAPKAGGEKKYNIIFVTIESFGSEYMSYFGNKDNLTPNLDKLAKEGLFFTNLKSTGTRTVRGLEALSLSIPPTPGNSIVRRPHNENLFNISSPLKKRGYDAKFLYGGFGYFDNMNYFFENNGFEVVDRAEFSDDEISFANIWGVSDEDLFDKVLKEADESYKNGKRFLNFVMTTSNHRPYTYPSGKIDIPSKTGRSGAVKYTDYAVGQLIKKAKEKEWFDNTIFVFVADHCAGSAGNTDVPIWRYQIPAIFYAPKIIKPQIFDDNVSQIDIAPTLFGVLNLNYKSKFFGIDVLNNEYNLDHHAFVSTYADIGYLENEMLYLLKPKKEKKFFNIEINKVGWQGSKEVLTKVYEKEELEEVIAYYQGASYLFKNGGLKNFKD